MMQVHLRYQFRGRGRDDTPQYSRKFTAIPPIIFRIRKARGHHPLPREMAPIAYRYSPPEPASSTSAPVPHIQLSDPARSLKLASLLLRADRHWTNKQDPPVPGLAPTSGSSRESGYRLSVRLSCDATAGPFLLSLANAPSFASPREAVNSNFLKLTQCKRFASSPGFNTAVQFLRKAKTRHSMSCLSQVGPASTNAMRLQREATPWRVCRTTISGGGVTNILSASWNDTGPHHTE